MAVGMKTTSQREVTQNVIIAPMTLGREEYEEAQFSTKEDERRMKRVTDLKKRESKVVPSEKVKRVNDPRGTVSVKEDESWRLRTRMEHW